MGEKRALRTLDEWEIDAALGVVVEPLPSSFDTPNTGIGCPDTSGANRRVCGSHLFDHDGTCTKDGEMRQRVICRTCGWKGTRRIARSRNGRLNGK